MALATEDDVTDTLGRELTDAEAAVVAPQLDRASDLVTAYLGGTPDPVPEPVTRVVADMVIAVLLKPSVLTADYQAGGYNTSREAAVVHVGTESATTIGPWLTKAWRQRLAPYMMRGGHAYSIDTTPPDVEDDEGS